MTTSVPQYKSPIDEALELSVALRAAILVQDEKAIATLIPKLRTSVQRMKSKYYNHPAFIVDMVKLFEKVEKSADAIADNRREYHKLYSARNYPL